MELRKQGATALIGGLVLLIAVVLPIYLALVLVPERGVVGAWTTASLAARLKDRGLDLERIAQGEISVPRLYAGRFPRDWNTLEPSARRKNVFFSIMLPLVLRENERILADRARLSRLIIRSQWSPRETRWLAKQATDYGVRTGEWSTLLKRMDGVPPALALAQAAVESGWGSSRFACEGNAVFGQWTRAEGRGMVPLERRQGTHHQVRKFRNLGASVAAYVRNLNTHQAYADFRTLRANNREMGQTLSGEELATMLAHYSETGNDYILLLLKLLHANGLERFDLARLSS